MSLIIDSIGFITVRYMLMLYGCLCVVGEFVIGAWSQTLDQQIWIPVL